MFERIGHPHTCHGSCRNRTPQRAIPSFAGTDTQDLVELGDEYRDVLSESDIPAPAPVAAGTDPLQRIVPGFTGADTRDLAEPGDEYRDVLSESGIPTPAPVAAGTEP